MLMSFRLWLKHVLLFILVERDDTMFNDVCLGFPALVGVLMALLPSLNICIWSCLSAEVTGMKGYLEPWDMWSSAYREGSILQEDPQGQWWEANALPVPQPWPWVLFYGQPGQSWVLADGPAHHFKREYKAWKQGEKTPASSQLKYWFGKPPPEPTANYSRGICKAFQGSQLFVAVNLIK